MKNFSLKNSELAEAVGGNLLCGNPDGEFTGIGTDTRKELSGQLYIPFAGANFDAHDFLDQAVEKGAVAIMASHGFDALLGRDDIAIVQVENTLKAFQELARWHRRRMKAQVVGITGSNGKTTTKEFAAAVLSESRSTYWNQGSFNNHWGVPISLLSIESTHEVALIEMGMNNAGEITELVQIAEPDVVVCTMVGTSHIGAFGSIEGIAKAKKEIYDGAPKDARMIFNLDNPYTREMCEEFKSLPNAGEILTFSSKESATIQMSVESATLRQMKVRGAVDGTQGEADIELFGSHNITNLMAAAAIARAVNVKPESIWAGLSRCSNTWGRGSLLQHSTGAEILFDGYNSSPVSMAALFENLKGLQCEGELLGVFGEMLELGDQTEEAHRELGRQAAALDFETIWFVGPSADAFEAGLAEVGFNKNLMKSNAYEQSLALKIESMLDNVGIVAIKGSRGIALEQVLAAWGLNPQKEG